MTSPILHALENEWHDITSHIHRHPYHDTNNPTGAPAMSLAETIRTDLTDGVAYVEGWVARMKEAAPAVIGHVETAENSVIVQALERFTLGPEGEALIADLIGKLATFGTAAVAAAPADPAAAAVPDPAAQSVA